MPYEDDSVASSTGPGQPHDGQRGSHWQVELKTCLIHQLIKVHERPRLFSLSPLLVPERERAREEVAVFVGVFAPVDMLVDEVFTVPEKFQVFQVVENATHVAKNENALSLPDGPDVPRPKGRPPFRKNGALSEARRTCTKQRILQTDRCLQAR